MDAVPALITHYKLELKCFNVLCLVGSLVRDPRDERETQMSSETHVAVIEQRLTRMLLLAVQETAIR